MTTYSKTPRPPMTEAEMAKAVIKWGAIAVVAITIVFGSFFTVQEGQRGIVFTFGELDSVKSPGLRLKLPIIQSVEKVSVRTQREDYDADAVSKNMQTVRTTVTLNYNLDPAELKSLYASTGLDVKTKIVYGRVQETVKAVAARYTAEELVTMREQVKGEITESLISQLREYHIVATPSGVQITNFSFSVAFNQAIEEKQVAEQKALTAKNDLERIKVEAEQKIAEAKGNAEAIRIQAQAIQTQGGKDYVSLKALEKWDGKLPQYVGSGPIPFLDLKK